MAQVACNINLGLSINTATMSQIISNLNVDNVNPPFSNPLLIAPETFSFAFQGNAVTCIFNNAASGFGETVLPTWASISQGILNICGSVGGSENIVGLTGLVLVVENAQIGFGTCGIQAETVAVELGHPNDPSTLVTGVVAANGTVLSVTKHSINN
ncbi:hypothetical protein B0H16DRAFT_1724871 [Mycena metata]|uniref:Uncharacterized protein n=1 Tax=Mycena metata TaxID=1033252 RepID=A0AAD7IT72_9AGAR|nr:hypothetical protein B0H16DRAFT_1724871 [Mycena metata]